MTEELKLRLKKLADKYEVASFCDQDPSQFIRWYAPGTDGIEGIANVECACFIAAMLAFGNRKQFIPKIRQILETADNWSRTCANYKDFNCDKGDRPLGVLGVSSPGVAAWCLAGAPDFPHGQKKFYRFYSYDDMHNLFRELALVLQQSPSFGEYIKNKVGAVQLPVSPAASALTHPQRPLTLDQIISQTFPESAIVPKGKNSANKRIHMFLRWMVRQNSPVDSGLWTWADPAELLIPLDVHVMQEAIGLGLLPPEAKATRKTAEQLSCVMAEVFPGDPCRGDFALFGLGVDKTIRQN